MIVIEKMITHILDPSTNVIVCSDTCNHLDDAYIPMLESKLTKAFTSPKRKTGVFKEGSTIKHLLEEYRSSMKTFEEMSIAIANYIFTAKCRCGIFIPTDLILAEVVYEERRYLVGLDNCYLEGLSHDTSQSGEQIENEITLCSTLLSSTLLKKDCAFMIEFGDYSVSSVEAQVEIAAEKRYFYSDIALCCESSPSYQDAYKTISDACEAVVEEYDLPSVQILPKMKQIIKDNVAAKEDINIEEVAQAVFADQPLAKQHFESQVKEKGVVKPISVEHIKSAKAEKVQKIRTDKGIEVIIPVDFMNSTEYVQFHTGEDGTISIELKNINRIISK